MRQQEQAEFCGELRRLMTERGLSLRALAKLANYDAGYLSKVANGLKPPSRELAERLDRVLAADGALLRLVAPPGHDVEPRPSDRAVAGRLSAAPSLKATAADVAVMRGMLTAFTASERQFGGAGIRAYASDYLRSVVRPRLGDAADGPVFRDLCATAVEFSLRVASMQLDAGHAGASRALLTSALPLAQQTGSPVMVAWVLTRFAEQDMEEGNAGRALSYTSGAAAMAENSSPRARAFILAKHAMALSMTGDGAQARRVLGRAQDAYAHAGNGGEPAWMSVYGEEHLQHDRGRCLNTLGFGDGAVDAAVASLRSRRLARPRAFSLAVAAIGHVRSKDKAVDRACEVTLELVAITAGLDSGRVRAQLRKVLTTLRPFQDCPAVKEAAAAARPVLGRLSP